MRSQTTIRPAAPGDLDALVELLSMLFSIEADFSVDAARQRRGLALMLEKADGCVMVAEATDRQVVGMCSGQLTISTAEGGPAALIEDLIVHREWQGRGIGRRLLDAVADWAGSQGARRLQLLADRNNSPALSFYRHLGWKLTAMICLRKTDDEQGRQPAPFNAS